MKFCNFNFRTILQYLIIMHKLHVLCIYAQYPKG